MTSKERGPMYDEKAPVLPSRSQIDDADGMSYLAFRRTLTPRYGLLWSHLGLGYLALVATGAIVVLTGDLLPALVRVAIGAILFGFFQAYIQLFFHEAAHYNIAPDRKRNDVLANLFIGALSGLEIGAYRIIHFDHHRHLGDTMDSERTYFDPLNVRFVVEAMLGVKGLRVLSRRDRIEKSKEPRSSAAAWRQRGFAAILHIAIVAAAVLSGQVALAIAWILGTLSFMPLFASVRQVLEHRSEDADEHTDYAHVDHGEVNRMFGDGPFASTFGGAGFNRHMLHHWEPQVSYTRLRDLENFLMKTNVAERLEGRRTTYFRTLWALVSW